MLVSFRIEQPCLEIEDIEQEIKSLQSQKQLG